MKEDDEKQRTVEGGGSPPKHPDASPGTVEDDATTPTPREQSPGPVATTTRPIEAAPPPTTQPSPTHAAPPGSDAGPDDAGYPPPLKDDGKPGSSGKRDGRAGGTTSEPEIELRQASMRGVWSDRTLHERLSLERLIRDETGENAFKWKRVDPAGYRLAMGPEVYISPAKASDKGSVRQLGEREAVLIPSGQFAFLCTEEIVRVPDDAFCFITLRSKRTKFRGLVNVSGFHADPGYDGRLVFAVFNAGPGDVHLRRGDELFAIMFADLDRPALNPRSTDEAFHGIPSDLIAPIAGELQSLAGLKENLDEVRDALDERVRSMEREVAILRWAVALILGAFVTLLVRALL